MVPDCVTVVPDVEDCEGDVPHAVTESARIAAAARDTNNFFFIINLSFSMESLLFCSFFVFIIREKD